MRNTTQTLEVRIRDTTQPLVVFISRPTIRYSAKIHKIDSVADIRNILNLVITVYLCFHLGDNSSVRGEPDVKVHCFGRLKTCIYGA